MNELLQDWLRPQMLFFNTGLQPLSAEWWKVSEKPQTFIAYTWGVFETHRTALLRRCSGNSPYEKIMQALRTKLEMNARIFPNGRFPGGLLARIPS